MITRKKGKKKKKNQPMLACFNSLLLNELIHVFPPTLLTNLNFCVFAVYLAGQDISLYGK